MTTQTFELYSSVYKGFITTAIITFLIGLTASGATTLNCYQVGYVVFALAIMLILIRLLNNLQTIYKNTASVGTTIFTIAPFILILFCISGLLYMNVIYKDIIVNGNVSGGYYTFSNTAVILLLIQLSIITSSMSEDTFTQKGFSSVTNSSVLLIGVLTSICTNIVRTILKYYTTDGFSMLNSVLKI
jgi:hypothetical protein